MNINIMRGLKRLFLLLLVSISMVLMFGCGEENIEYLELKEGYEDREVYLEYLVDNAQYQREMSEAGIDINEYQEVEHIHVEKGHYKEIKRVYKAGLICYSDRYFCECGATLKTIYTKSMGD